MSCISQQKIVVFVTESPLVYIVHLVGWLHGKQQQRLSYFVISFLHFQ